jgi:DNA-binding GntR family transcriptional regulator
MSAIAQQRSDSTIRDVPVEDVFRGAALKRRASADLIAAGVRDRILAGDLVPGDALREAELAEAFGVARNTVREGLRLLTQGGLATYEMHRGVTVRRHTAAEVAAVFEVRAIIEEAAARRAGTLEAGEAARLRRAMEDSESADAVGDVKGVLTANLEFHRELVRLLGNPKLDDIFNQLLAELRLILTPLDRDVGGAWLGRNRELFDLLVDGDAATFRSRLQRYLEDSRRDVVARIGGA